MEVIVSEFILSEGNHIVHASLTKDNVVYEDLSFVINVSSTGVTCIDRESICYGSVPPYVICTTSDGIREVVVILKPKERDDTLLILAGVGIAAVGLYLYLER